MGFAPRNIEVASVSATQPTIYSETLTKGTFSELNPPIEIALTFVYKPLLQNDFPRLISSASGNHVHKNQKHTCNHTAEMAMPLAVYQYWHGATLGWCGDDEDYMNVIYFGAVKRALIHVKLAAMTKRLSNGRAAKSIFTALALTLLGVAFFTGAASAKDGDIIEAGRVLSERLCGRCHATGAVDNSPLAKAPPFRTFKSKWPLSYLEEALAEGIVTGHADMPQFSFSTAEIGQLLSRAIGKSW